jgi:formylglycine-generating enzyme required for sulfatase activity/predicted MPP superfamily phosphohydrolase
MNASGRVELLEQRNPALIRLACLVSPAARVDPAVLRSVRLSLMPATRAGIEGDLWFSPLVQAANPGGFQFYPDVANLLRTRLAADPELFERTSRLIADAHQHQPPLLRLEEEIFRLTFSRQEDRLAEIDKRLLPLVAALKQPNRRGIARWVTGMATRLPSKVQTATLARLQLLAKAQILGVDFVHGEGQQLTEDEVRDVLTVVGQVKVGVRLREDRLELFEPPVEGSQIISVPAARSRSVELTWRDDTRQELVWPANEAVSVQAGTLPAVIRTLSGQRFRVGSRRSMDQQCNALVRTYLVTVADQSGSRVFPGVLFDKRHVATTDAIVADPSDDDVNDGRGPGDRDFFIHFPFLEAHDPIPATLVPKASPRQDLGQAESADHLLVFLEVNGRLPRGCRPCSWQNEPFEVGESLVGIAFLPKDLQPRWEQFRTVAVGANVELAASVDMARSQLRFWCGSPLVDSNRQKVFGILHIESTADTAMARLIGGQSVVQAWSAVRPRQARRTQSNPRRTQANVGEELPVRVLHLSDLHFGPERRWESDRVLNGLAGAIGQLVAEGLAPDIVAITGDIASSGRAADYEEAKRWIDTGLLKRLPPRFPRSRILMVPGNHDVDRSMRTTAAQGLRKLLLDGQSQETITKVLSDEEERGTLLKRHTHYLEFANSYRTAKTRLAVPWWSQVLVLNGMPIHFVGLCSSWMSWSDDDHGRLLVGRYQLTPLLDENVEAAFRVVLIHHPWDYVAEFDSRQTEPLVRRRADVLLRGHLHPQRTRLYQDPDEGHLELAAGSVYDGSQSVSAFQLLELFPKQRLVRVHYRVWHDGHWLPDKNAYQGAEDGVASISLRRDASHPAPAASADATRYLQALRDRTSRIDIRGLQVGSGRAMSFPIDESYIPLSTNWVGPQAEDRLGRGRRGGGKPAASQGEETAERARRVELHEALQVPRVVIVGEPGTGKTTFLHRVASLLCRMRLGDEKAASRVLGLDSAPFPILIRLADLSEHVAQPNERKAGPLDRSSPAWLPHYLATHCREDGLGLDEDFFRRQLESGQAIVLLDALDEVPTLDARKALVALVEQAGTVYGDCRFVLTSRPAAYRGEAVLPRWAEVQIEPLEDEAINAFLARWCQALFRDQPTLYEEHLRELQLALASRPELRRLARIPVMLTALAVVHWNEKRLPEQRGDLYESIITWLARSREQRKGRPSPERCVGLLQNLALAMHDHPNGRQVQIKRFAAAQVLAPALRDVPPDERQAAAERFLAEEEVDSGIVIGRGEDDIRFWHLTFQEYLAARALAGCSDADQRQRLLSQSKLYLPEWREVVLLFAGVLYHTGFERVDRMFGAVFDSLGNKPSLADQARCVGLLGAAVRDLAPVRYEISDPRYQRTLDAVLGVFDAERNAIVPIRQAIEAADALGQNGDPRFEPEQRRRNWITIPVGEFWMGAQQKNPEDRNYDPYADDRDWPEMPVHKVYLDEYHIAKYPVTVGEYYEFVEAGGYGLRHFWEGGGFGKFELPGGWEHQLVCPSRPVVNVSWYEASAYAAWAGCRLPTEAQWERAARGSKARRYSWGNEDPDHRRMNYTLNVGHPTPRRSISARKYTGWHLRPIGQRLGVVPRQVRYVSSQTTA